MPLQLRHLEFRRIALDLVTPFRTSFGVETRRDVLLLRVETDHGDGWGECVALQEPRYSPEFVDGAQLVVRDHLWPALTGGGPDGSIDNGDFAAFFSLFFTGCPVG